MKKLFQISNKKFPVKNIIGTISTEELYKTFLTETMLDLKEATDYKYFILADSEKEKIEATEIIAVDSEKNEIIIKVENLYLPKENSEILFKEMLEETLNELKIRVEHQYPAEKYRIDFFIPEYNLAIEYDESYHELKIKEDSEREKEINKILGCDFVRCSYKDSNIKNIIKILKKIGIIIG